MSIDPELLRQLSARRPSEQQGVAALVRGIHITPGLRDWVTLESVALVPIPVQRQGRWALLALLTVSQRAEDGTDGYLAPWGAVEWSWPERRVTQMLDLREREEIRQLREQHKFIKKYAAAEQVPLDLITQAQREQVLFQKLDEFLAAPPQEPSQLAQLAVLYSGVLPKEIYP